MEFLYSPQSHLLWTAILAVALFYPVRQLIWVVSVRRLERREGQSDESQRQRLKRRASATSALLCFVFAYLYTSQFMGAPA